MTERLRELERVLSADPGDVVEKLHAHAEVQQALPSLLGVVEDMETIARSTPHNRGCDAPDDPDCPACIAASALARLEVGE